MSMNNEEKNTYVRKQILNTLLEMMKEQPFDSITISALTKQAKVGRASFYRNFSNLKDVLFQESNRVIKGWDGHFSLEGTDASKSLISLLDYLKKHDTFYLSLYNAGMEDVIKESIFSQFTISDELPNAVAYVLSYAAYSIYGWIIEWIKRGMHESGTELAAMFEATQKK